MERISLSRGQKKPRLTRMARNVALLLGVSTGCGEDIPPTPEPPDVFHLAFDEVEIPCGIIPDPKNRPKACDGKKPEATFTKPAFAQNAPEVRSAIRNAVQCIFSPLNDVVTVTDEKPLSGPVNTVLIGGEAIWDPARKSFTAGLAPMDTGNRSHKDTILIATERPEYEQQPSSTYPLVDIVSFTTHEIGHALGLNHNPDARTFMYEDRNGVPIDQMYFTHQEAEMLYKNTLKSRRPGHDPKRDWRKDTLTKINERCRSESWKLRDLRLPRS